MTGNQLSVVGKKLDIPVFQMGKTDPVDIAKASIRYNLASQKVDANYKGIVIENGKKMMVK